MSVWKGVKYLSVAWSNAGTTSDSVALEPGSVPARLEVDPDFAGTSIRLQLQDAAGVWRTVTFEGYDYVIPVAPNKSTILDPRAVWALADGLAIRLVSSAAEEQGRTATLVLQAGGL